MDLYEFDQRIEQAMHDMPPALGPWLLEVLTTSAEDRARAIGELYASG